MSWGYFGDLRLTLATSEWARINQTKPIDIPLKAGWSGLAERNLEEAFGNAFSPQDSFAKILAGAGYHAREVVHTVATKGKATTIRICLMLEKSILEMAYPLATLFLAAQSAGGTGTLRFVNDGSASGEDGVILTLANGKITKKKIDDCWPLAEELGHELYNIGTASKGGKGKGKGKGINPFTGKPL